MHFSNKGTCKESFHVVAISFIRTEHDRKLISAQKKSTKDFDGDGRKESPEEEYKGSVDKAIKANLEEVQQETFQHTFELHILEGFLHFFLCAHINLG